MVIISAGLQGNAWSAAVTGAGGTSAVIYVAGCDMVHVFGTTSGASTLTLQVSQDGLTWYDDPTTVAANGNFGDTWFVACTYVRIKSSASVTATVTVSCNA